jgi:redox-sensing transcriptional repressor
VENGITAMLNFTYAELDLPEHVIVENMHISDTLMTLSYGLTEKSD